MEEERHERSLDGYILMKINEIKNIRIKSDTLRVDFKRQRIFYTERKKKKLVVGHIKSLRNY